MSATPAARSGVDRAAILLLALGEQDAAQVLRHLGPADVQRVGAAMAQLAAVSREEVAAVLSSFTSSVEQTSFGGGTEDYLRKVLVEALGPDRAGGVIDRVLQGRSRGLEALKWTPARSIGEMLRAEHPQIIATVLSYLEPDHAAQVLMLLPETVRPEILMRVATLDGVHPTALNELDEVLEKQLSGANGAKAATGFGGPKVAAEILNMVGTAEEGTLLSQIAKADEPLSQKLQDLMFVFADLLDVDDRGLQELLREVPGDKLIIALKAADEKLKQKFFKNMSERAAQMMKDDLEAKGPVRLSEVEAAQKEIVVTARRMAEEGRMSLGGKGGETYV